jgi:hypothetical protein
MTLFLKDNRTEDTPAASDGTELSGSPEKSSMMAVGFFIR